MGLPDRQQQIIRLTPEQIGRISRAANHLSVSKQTFMQQAVLAEADRVLADRQETKLRRQERREERMSREPAGLGLGLRPRTEEPVAPEAAPVPGVVVNVGTPQASGPALGGKAGLIDGLATSVLKGSEVGRHQRMQRAVDVLRSVAETDEERIELAKMLDIAVDVRLKAKAHPAKGGGPFSLIGQAAAETFDKMKDLLTP